jgi:hypothetical protein
VRLLTRSSIRDSHAILKNRCLWIYKSLKGKKNDRKKGRKKREKELENRERKEEKGGERTRKQAIFRYFLYIILPFL